MMPLPEPIGKISGRRLTPTGTREFWGYFADDVGDHVRNVTVYAVDQMRAYAAAEREADREVMRGALEALTLTRQMLAEWHADRPTEIGEKEPAAMDASRAAITALTERLKD